MVMDDFLLEIKSSFVEEANDLLNEFQDYLNEIDDEITQEHIDNAFRIIHTLKGNGKACGFDDLSSEIHTYENYLTEIRSRGVANRQAFVDKNLSLVSELFKILESLKLDLNSKVDLSELRNIVESLTAKSLKFAIIDDEPELVKLQETLIEAKFPNASVSLFTDSKKGLSSVESEKYDLIITDFNMPDVNGNDIIKSVRAREGSENFSTPIIMITAYKPPMFSDGDLHRNVFYIEKPFTQKSFYYYIHCAQKLTNL